MPLLNNQNSSPQGLALCYSTYVLGNRAAFPSIFFVLNFLGMQKSHVIIFFFNSLLFVAIFFILSRYFFA